MPDPVKATDRDPERNKPRRATGWPHYRSPHRAAADREASRAMENLPLPQVLDDPRVPANTPELIETDAALADLIERLRAAGGFAYDTEFIGERTYHPRFCVIQVATPDRVTLIDGLADLDLAPFWSLLTDPDVLKLVHAGDQDLEPAVRLAGGAPAAVYDTQIVAGFAGLVYPLGLTALAAELCDADFGGDFKFSSWDRRPLTPTQLVYAANDVRYLWLIKDELDRRLADTGYAAWAEEENRLRCHADRFTTDPLAVKVKAKKKGAFKRRHLAVLHPLMRWRDQLARENDVPVRAILDDAALVRLVEDPPADLAAFRKVKGLPWPIKDYHGEALSALIREAVDGPLPPKRPRLRPLNGPAQAALESIWRGFLTRCDELGLSPALVANKKEITALVRARHMGDPWPKPEAGDGNGPVGSRLLTGWRQEALGDLLAPLTPDGVN